MNKQQLANKIWESANRMRSKIEANEYKDYILGFIFYKYLSDTELRFLKENDYTDAELPTVVESDSDTVDWLQKNIGYFISYEALFSTWLSSGKNFDVSNVRDALSAFSRLISPTHKKVFENVFRTLETGLSKLGDTSGAQTKAISGLLQLIKDIPMDGKQDYDVLGFVYEYLISNFAANAGKKAGEFYTPHEVSLLMSEIVANHLKGKSEIKIYDPTSGSGSLLINIGRCVSKYMSDPDTIKYYAQELKENTYNLTRMNLIMRGIKPDNIVTRNADTLEDDWPYFDESDPHGTYDPLYVDAVVSNPPYSQVWDPEYKENDVRYKEYGLAPKGKADYAFLLHDLYHVKPDGIMNIVLPHGVLFRGGEEGKIRRNLIEKNNIDAIIGLPANIFFGTGIPTIIMVLKQPHGRKNSDILIIDASKGFVKEGKNNKLRASDIKRIVDTVANRVSIPKFSKVVSRDEIRANDYNLNIPRYVDSSENAESWDVYASMCGGIPKTELEELSPLWESFPNLKAELFTDDGTPYVHLAVTDIKTAIKQNSDVLDFEKKYHRAFAKLQNTLRTALIDTIDNVEINKQEELISTDIFACLKDFSLIDKYEAYQILDDSWTKIAADLEIIQTEGFDATKQVDPNLVLKKKDGKDVEIQDGWFGHIIPFDLVQKTILKKQYESLKQKEARLAEIPSELDEIIDSLSEEEKESDILNEAKDSFVAKEVSNKRLALCAVATEEEKALLDKLTHAEELLEEEKKLKTEIKKEDAELQASTKSTIENLTDDQVNDLLEQKWITPLHTRLISLPDTVIDTFVSKLQALSKKYENTYFDIEKEIHQTGTELAGMIDQLCGSEFDLKGLEAFKSLLIGE